MPKKPSRLGVSASQKPTQTQADDYKKVPLSKLQTVEKRFNIMDKKFDDLEMGKHLNKMDIKQTSHRIKQFVH